MPVKIRLARHGRKRNAYYYIVVANSRAPRDGKFIERIGSYNPNTNPATIELDFDKALNWLNKGAQPTDTARAILSHEGVMMMKHLLGGVKKGAFDEAAAKEKFAAWKASKEQSVEVKKNSISEAAKKEQETRLVEETKIKEARLEAIAKRKAEAEAEKASAEEEAIESNDSEESAEA